MWLMQNHLLCPHLVAGKTIVSKPRCPCKPARLLLHFQQVVANGRGSSALRHLTGLGWTGEYLRRKACFPKPLCCLHPSMHTGYGDSTVPAKYSTRLNRWEIGQACEKTHPGQVPVPPHRHRKWPSSHSPRAVVPQRKLCHSPPRWNPMANSAVLFLLSVKQSPTRNLLSRIAHEHQ